jgi:hypothetical protein
VPAASVKANNTVKGVDPEKISGPAPFLPLEKSCYVLLNQRMTERF